MSVVFLIIGLLAGIAIGGLLVYIQKSSGISKLKSDLTVAQTQADERERENSVLRDQAEKDHKVIERLKPFEEKLETVKVAVSTIEKERQQQYAGLKEQLENVQNTEKNLHESTKSLEGALKSTTIRGSWGEIELERILELSGLRKNIDYSSQKTIDSENSKKPDVIVILPGKKHIAVDAKTSMASFFRAKELEKDINSNKDAKREYDEKVKEHISSVKSHIKTLGNKEYYKELGVSPDFTIMFMPSESMLELALSHDSSINEYAAKNNVLLSTPISLLGILKSVASIWRYFEFAKDAKDLQKLGQDLFDSLSVLAKKMASLGRAINSSGKNYNEMIGSFEANFLSKIKKVKGIDSSSLEELEGIHDSGVKEISKPELLEDSKKK